MRKLGEKRILKTITRELSGLKEVLAIILYGSYARGDYGAKSDVDLFIVVENSADKEKIEDAIIQLENKISKSIQPTIRKRKELNETDSGLLQNIFQEGKLLYLKEPLEIVSALLLKQKPFVLFTFELKNLSQKEKAKFNRKLYPHAIQGYKYQGLLQKIGGEKKGIDLIIERVESEIFDQRVYEEHDFDLALVSFAFGTDPDVYSFFHSSVANKRGSFNVCGFADNDVDQLLEEARSKTDRGIRTKL